jgi:hypothetical protein
MEKSGHPHSRRSWRRVGAALSVVALAAIGTAIATPAEGVTPDLLLGVLDHQQIEDLAYCYAAGTDAIGGGDLQKGKDIYEDCFTPDAVVEAFAPGSDPDGPPDLSAVGRDAWADVVDAVFSANGYVATQHLMSNIRIRPHFTTAKMTSYVHATHVLEPASSVDLAAGTYKDVVVHTPAGWRIARRTLLLISFLRVESPSP